MLNYMLLTVVVNGHSSICAACCVCVWALPYRSTCSIVTAPYVVWTGFKSGFCSFMFVLAWTSSFVCFFLYFRCTCYSVYFQLSVSVQLIAWEDSSPKWAYHCVSSGTETVYYTQLQGTEAVQTQTRRNGFWEICYRGNTADCCMALRRLTRWPCSEVVEKRWTDCYVRLSHKKWTTN